MRTFLVIMALYLAASLTYAHYLYSNLKTMSQVQQWSLCQSSDAVPCTYGDLSNL